MLTEAERDGIVATQVMAMPHRCTIERDCATGGNPYGGRSTPDWCTVVSDEPCRLVTQERVTYGLQQDELVEELVLSGHLLYLCPDVDVRGADRVRIAGDAYTVTAGLPVPEQLKAALAQLNGKKFEDGAKC